MNLDNNCYDVNPDSPDDYLALIDRLREDEIYETQIRTLVEADNHGRIVAIDIETGAFTIASLLSCNISSMARKQIFVVKQHYKGIAKGNF